MQNTPLKIPHVDEVELSSVHDTHFAPTTEPGMSRPWTPKTNAHNYTRSIPAQNPDAQEFDASRVFEGFRLSDEALLQNQSKLAQAAQQSSLSLLRDEIVHELLRLACDCNRAAWGHFYQGTNRPNVEQAEELTKRLGRNFIIDAKEALRLRRLLGDVDRALEDKARAQDQADRERWVLEEAERERREFEASEAADRERRFEEWQARRRA